MVSLLLFFPPVSSYETIKTRVREAVRTAMIAAGGDALKVPLKVDIGVGRSWDEAH